jgi:hypothetical protein
VWVNLPSALFSDVLILAMSGGLSSIELTTEKLRRDMGDVFGIRFATGELRSSHPERAAMLHPERVEKSGRWGGSRSGR